MRDLQSSLARFQPARALDAKDLFLLRRRAWRQQGVAVLLLAEIRDDWTRQIIINEADRLYGRREGSR